MQVSRLPRIISSMANYAVVKISGSQYKIKDGDQLTVDHLEGSQGAKVTLGEVLLLVANGKVEIGTPKIESVQIEARLVGHEKGEKIRVSRFRAKSRYRKTKGFRSLKTKIRIEKIKDKKTLSSKKTS